MLNIVENDRFFHINNDRNINYILCLIFSWNDLSVNIWIKETNQDTSYEKFRLYFLGILLSMNMFKIFFEEIHLYF
jgi:hypothetical protein